MEEASRSRHHGGGIHLGFSIDLAWLWDFLLVPLGSLLIPWEGSWDNSGAPKRILGAHQESVWEATIGIKEASGSRRGGISGCLGSLWCSGVSRESRLIKCAPFSVRLRFLFIESMLLGSQSPSTVYGNESGSPIFAGGGTPAPPL